MDWSRRPGGRRSREVSFDVYANIVGLIYIRETGRHGGKIASAMQNARITCQPFKTPTFSIHMSKTKTPRSEVLFDRLVE
jgi:hypothetical protein